MSIEPILKSGEQTSPKIEEDGFICAYRAQVNAERLGLTVQAFVQVQLDRHGQENSQEFNRILSTSPEIISAWTLTGEADYLLRVYCLDLRDLNRLIHEVLLKSPCVSRVQSQIVMDQCKADLPCQFRDEYGRFSITGGGLFGRCCYRGAHCIADGSGIRFGIFGSRDHNWPCHGACRV